MSALAKRDSVLPPDRVSCPGPGIYQNVPFDTYVSWNALNHSTLRLMGDKTPAHFKWAIDHPSDKKTASKRRGTAIHELLLEPDRLANRVKIGPVNPSTGTCYGTDTQKWKAAEAESPGMFLTSTEEMETLKNIADAAFAHGDLGPMLRAAGDCEVCLVWDDTFTGMRCKARIDKRVRTALGVIRLDLKTCQSASDSALSRSVIDYGYGTQDEFYARGCRALGLNDVGIFAAIETEPPHGIRVYRMGPESIPKYRSLVIEWLSKVKRGRETGEWPSYPEGIIDVEAPEWWNKQYATAS